MHIALDAMGSDNAPYVEVEGAVQASLDGKCKISLVGNEEILKRELEKFPKRGDIEIVHASEHITMDDQPVNALRQKKDSSLLVALRKLKNREVDAVVSAGNTGAVMVGARLVLGVIRGISRPAIAQALPTRGGRVVLLDLGANVDCEARHLYDFAYMGMAYSKYALGVENPRVGLINIGGETTKGNMVLKQAYQMLSQAEGINFVGNIEPNRVFEGETDVAVCDGLIGNIILKTAEAVAKFVGEFMKEQIEKSSMSKLGAVLARSAFLALKKTINPNEYPGAPLLGVQGVVIVLHGASTSVGIANGIRGAATAVESNLIGHIEENVQHYGKSKEVKNANSVTEPITGDRNDFIQI